MFQGTFENDIEQFGESNFGLLQKSQFLDLLRPIDNFHNTRLQNNFEEIFLTTFAPNCSTFSVCTQEDRNIQTFSMGGDFYGESVDHFFDDHCSQEPLPSKHGASTNSTPQKQENSLQVKKIQTVSQKIEAEEPQKDEDLQNCQDETKNIPKNYIKAIFAFILENQEYMQRLLKALSSSESSNLRRFTQFIRQEKRIKKYTIQRLKQLWTSPQNGKAMRIISGEFLRKRCLGYIFGSKIEKKMSHIKHRYKFIEAVENPSEFTNIK